MGHGIKTIIIPVRDLAAAKTLYGTVLGVEPYADEPYYVGFRVGDQEIGLDPNGHNHGMTGPVGYCHVGDVTAEPAPGRRRGLANPPGRQGRRRGPTGRHRRGPQRQRPRSPPTPTGHPRQDQLRRPAMTAIEYVTLEVADPTAADRFYTAAFGLDAQVRVRASDATDDRLPRVHAVARGVPAGHRQRPHRRRPRRRRHRAEAGREVALGLRRRRTAPDGTIWTVATSAKKDTGPATRQIDEIVLQLGVADVAASKRFYVDRGLAVAKSFGRRYVEFAARRVRSSWRSTDAVPSPRTPASPPTAPDRTGIVIGSDAGPFTDPDGFAWEAV